MIVDFHAHVGDFRMRWDDPHPALTWNDLLARLDEEGVDQAVFLPVYNGSPEESPLGMLCGEGLSVADQVRAAAQYRPRVIPFTNVDPRAARDCIGAALDWAVKQGCRGIGELMCKLPCDDPAVVNLFKLAGERGLLVTIESSSMLPGEAGLADEPGAPRLEHLLQLAPQTRIVGHGPAFWAEFGVVRTHAEKGTRAVGKPLGGDGALPRLFRTYPNLYADLSAASGFCALTREVNRGIEFLNEFQDRLLFGTDLISFGDARRRQELRAVGRRMIEKLITERKLDLADWQALDWHHSYMPQLDYLKALCSEGLLGREAYERIVGRNAAALLGLDESLGHP